MEDYVQKIPQWMVVALGEIGVAEIPGEANNPRVVEYHSATSLKATEDFVAWCSAFACWVMECAFIPSTRSAAARSWLQWGKELETPRFGCLAVLERGTLATQGHVGFVVDWDASKVYLLAGNQEDKVSIRAFPRASVLGFRWPADYTI